MKNKTSIILTLTFALVLVYCNQKANSGQDTILKGKINILVDETLTPIVEDQVQVFESVYDAKVSLISKSETEVLQSLIKDSTKVAILSSKLSKTDSLTFANRKIIAHQTVFATDAIALIANKKSNDTLIDLQMVIDFMQGKSVNKIKGLVFDNPNSSSMRLLKQFSGLATNPEKGIFSFKTNEEVIKYVSENDGMIGVVGVNWLMQPTQNVVKFKQNINILSVKGLNKKDYFYPSQNNLAEKTYPLARDLYIINCQTYAGLGKGFGSFITSERGQRIVLKSGLLPVRVPSRIIQIRK